MNPTLYNDIKEMLTEFLNRSPTEDEIINAQTDLIIMGKVRDKEIADIQKRLGM